MEEICFENFTDSQEFMGINGALGEDFVHIGAVATEL